MFQDQGDLLPAWIAHVFDHPVEDPPWYWSSDAPEWKGSREQVATLIAETFERSGDLLARLTDAQLNQGFWHLISNLSAQSIYSLVDLEVPMGIRLRALRSFVPLFEQVMAARCSPHLSHLDEQPANPLNSACYMWWDILPIHGEPENASRKEFDAEVLRVLQQLLAIPHDACRESALHGLSEWQFYYPAAQTIVAEWLERTPGLRPELAAYAENARFGFVA